MLKCLIYIYIKKIVSERGPSGMFRISSFNVSNFTFQLFTTWFCGLPLTLMMKKKTFYVLVDTIPFLHFISFDIMRMFSHMGLYFLQQFETGDVLLMLTSLEIRFFCSFFTMLDVSG